MRAALFGALGAREVKPPVSVILDSHESGDVAFPADMNYVTIVAVDRGQNGAPDFDGHGGGGGAGGSLRMAVNLPKGSHTGVSMNFGGSVATAKWDFAEGTPITLALKTTGGSPNFIYTGDPGGGGGGRGGTETNGNNGSGISGGTRGTDAAIFSAALSTRPGSGGTGGNMSDGNDGGEWGGGGGGAAVTRNPGAGGGGGALLMFSEIPIAYP